jgi:putative ABC transport system permease protein
MPEWLHHPLVVRGLQVLVIVIVALAVAFFCRRQGIHLFRQTLIAILRGLVQIVLVGLVLVFLLQKPGAVSIPVLAVMIVAAALIAGRRARGLPGAFTGALAGILTGSAAIITLAALIGALKFSVDEMVPVGSMLIANTMNTCALALERFRSDVAQNVGRVEAALSLGADPARTVGPYVTAAAEASMIPRIDNLASLGIVWIPGLMAGMLIQGGSPIDAALYNFTVIAMILASSGIAATAALSVVRKRAFTPAGQLLVRPPEITLQKPRKSSPT